MSVFFFCIFVRYTQNRIIMRRFLCAGAGLAACCVLAFGQIEQRFDPIVISGDSLTINAYPNSDRIPDYSYCGFKASEEQIPDLLADPRIPVIRLQAPKGDATALIQRALDYAGSLPDAKDGFKAVVLLEKGVYEVQGSLRIRSGGVVLRGQGSESVIRGCGTGRETLLRIEGEGSEYLGKETELDCDYLPVNSSYLPLGEGHGLKQGDFVLITRPSTAEWIRELRADELGYYADYNLPAWKSGDFDLKFHRKVLSADAKGITLDAPLPQSFDRKWGGGTVRKSIRNGIISNFAVENLCLESEFEAGMPKDEDHRWIAISIDNARDGWVRRVDAKHFVSSAVALFEGASRISVVECRSLSPVGEIGGYRRLAFQTFGEQTLFVNCYSEQGYHDFSVGQSTAGPNAFIQCYAADSHGFSGALGGWSCGTLFERVTVENAPIKFTNLELDLQGGGWSSANSMCWMCRAPQIHVADPPQTHNWAYGSRGQAYGGGSHAQSRIFKPECFYFIQLAQRGVEIPSREAETMIHYNPDFSKTDAAFARQQSLRAKESAWTTSRWIDSLRVWQPLTEDARASITLPEVKKTKAPAKPSHPISIANGRIAVDGHYLAGRSARTALWRGSLRRSEVNSAGIHLTRFVPGREGRGYTDNMDSLKLQLEGYASLSHYPALWYERRRDDHGRMTRADADVWAPFYEQPFARSGQEQASDRLSRYDLESWNKWYWSRLQEFSFVAQECGLGFIHEHYLQHNIIEEGAHWIDYPWRDANNINSLGFSEPTYMQGDKRVFMASQFYDLGNDTLRGYHRKYIRKSLESVECADNVLHHIGAEYTGPADFMEFWLRTIMEWEEENGRDVKVVLNATKDVTDKILADPELQEEVDVIDIRHWYHRTDSLLYAPEGGVSLAPRQYQRIMDTGQTDGGCVWATVLEYRKRYPQKALLYNATRDRGAAWIAFLAGASLCQIPQTVQAPNFYTNALDMSPLYGGQAFWIAGKKALGYIAYTQSGRVELDLSGDPAAYRLQWIDPGNGATLGKSSRIRGGDVLSLEAPQNDCVDYLYS